MDLYVVDTEASGWTSGRVSGLDVALADAMILDRPLAAWREGAREVTADVVGPALVVGRDTFVSPGFRRAAAALAATRREVARVVVAGDHPLALADPLARLRTDDGHVAFDAWIVPPGARLAALDAAARASAAPVSLDVRARTFRFPADPEVAGRDELALTFAGAVVGPIGHWVELHRVNVLALGGQPLEQRRGANLARYLVAAVRALALSGPRLAGKLNRVGVGVDIHPSAVVEGCRLGDFAEVGPGAYLKGVVVGKDARIEAQAIAELSVIGEGARLQRRAMANVCVVGRGARVGGTHQFSLIGPRAATKMYAVGTDMRLGGKVRVETPDGLREVDLGYMGPLIGADAFVASGVWIAPGRVVGNGARVGRARELISMGAPAVTSSSSSPSVGDAR